VRVDLVEYGPAVEARLSLAVGLALTRIGFVDARQIPGSEEWELRPLNKVGAIRVRGDRATDDVEVHIRPKIDIRRVIGLLEWSPTRVAWRDDVVNLRGDDDLLTAVVEAFTRLTGAAMAHGLIQGYRTVDEALTVVRGRIREADQMKRRFALPVPIEVRYDDFTADTPENRLLRLATHLCVRLPGLTRDLRRRIHAVERHLDGVALVTHRSLLEPWHPSRLNTRFHLALRLAQVIVDGTSFDLRSGALAVTGFVIDMAKVFEDVVCSVLGRALTSVAGRCETQDRWFLDHAETVAMLPDLVWYRDEGPPRAVVDAKYKAEKPAGFPDADLYQMLAYCTALGLREGHLIYARGNEMRRSTQVVGAGVFLHAHTVDLDVEARDVVGQLRRIAEGVARGSDGV
jgi:5-methylcytosine-specific restriction enzyme subunit McrC